MRQPSYDPDDQVTIFDGIGLDDVTVARLMEVCGAANAPPAAIIASIVRDVLEDDAAMHDDGPVIVRGNANNDLH